MEISIRKSELKVIIDDEDCAQINKIYNTVEAGKLENINTKE